MGINSKLYLASKDVYYPGTSKNTGKDHGYIVLDEDGDTNTINDEYIIRGGPPTELSPTGPITIEIGMALDNSRDQFNTLQGLTPASRNYTELTDLHGLTVDQTWTNLETFASSLGNGTFDPDGRAITNVPYSIFGHNSNSTETVILSGVGINYYANTPKEGGTGARINPDIFTGNEDWYLSGSSAQTISIFDTTHIRNISDYGTGNTTYLIDLANFSGNTSGYRAPSIYGDANSASIDKIIIKGADTTDISFMRGHNGEIFVFKHIGGGQPDQPLMVIKGQSLTDLNGHIDSIDVVDSSGVTHSISINDILNNTTFSRWETPITLNNLIANVEAAFTAEHNLVCPLVLDLDGDGIELSQLNNTGSVYWDGDVDGFREASGWVKPDDGLLVRDVNANGVIDNNSELFGNTTTYANGFLNLKSLDSNSDNLITSADAQWSSIKVWKDTNQDGVSQSTELYTLSSLGITQINLGYSTSATQIAGNDIKETSTFVMGGVTKTIDDVWFATDQVNSVYDGATTFNVNTLVLPILRGYGTLPDLDISMSQNSALLAAMQTFSAKTIQQLIDPTSTAKSDFQAILYKWAGVESVVDGSRGVYMDAKQLAFLEKLMGQSYTQLTFGSPNPNPNEPASDGLTNAYNEAFDAFYARVAFQAGGSDFFTVKPAYNPVTDAFEGTGVTLDMTNIQSAFTGNTLKTWDLAKQWLTVFSILDQAYSMTGLSVADQNALTTYVASTDTTGHITYADLSAAMHGTVDTVNGTTGADIIITPLNDNTTPTRGGDGNDIMFGSFKVDDMRGGNGNDILVGGKGNDILQGNNGDDTYVVAADGSVDSINDNATTASTGDVLYIQGAYTAGQITTARDTISGYDMNVFANGVKVAKITSQFSSSLSSVESIALDNGSTINLTTIQYTTNGTAAAETINGIRTGGNPDDIINGLGGNDSIYGQEGNDTMNGGAGADYLEGSVGNDTYIIASGEGSDTIYETSGTNDTIKFTGTGLTNANLTLTQSSWDLLISFSGTQYAKVQNYFYSSNQIETLVFSDNTTKDLTQVYWTMTGTAAAEDLFANTGVIRDIIYGMGGNDRVYGYAGNDMLYGGDGNDTVRGGDDDDTLWGDLGDDDLGGDNGNDIIYGDSGNDTINGGAGTDLLTYANITTGVTVTLGSISQQNTIGAGLDTISNIENLTGTAYADTLTGNSVANTIDGGAGDDYINGGSNGNDFLIGGLGTDTLSFSVATAGITINLATTSAQVTGGAGTDTISGFENAVGSAYADTITGTTGNNIIEGAAGNDILNGAGGIDTVSYEHATAAVTVNLATLTSQNTVGAGSDTLSGFENILGSAYADTLTGDGNANTIEGGAGNDVLNGAGGTDTVSYEHASAAVTVNLATATSQNTVGAGSDTLSNFENLLGSMFNDTLTGNTGNNVINGHGGANTLTGGTGADTFVFDVAHMGSSDTVTDFSTAQSDKIDVSQILVGYDPLTSAIHDFITFTTSGANTVMSVDRDGTGTAYTAQAVATLTAVTGLDADTMLANHTLIAV